MKKVLFVLMTAMLLMACGDNKVHESIDENLANDSRQVMNILSDALDEDMLSDDLPQDKVDILNSYGDKYYEENRDSALFFNEVEEEVITFSLATITRYVQYTGLESDKDKILEGKKNVENMIRTGKDYAELNK